MLRFGCARSWTYDALGLACTAMDVRPSTLPDTREILRLARSDKAAAEQAVAQLSLDEQVALVCAAPMGLRSRVLELTPAPEEVIPRMPDAELCFTAKAVGLWDADWILEHASETQIVTSLDLDGWVGPLPDGASLRSWLAALAHAGDGALLRTARSVDTELLVLMLRDRVHVLLDPNDEEWQAPEGARTLDGQFAVQVLMWNPAVFPQLPEQFTHGLRVEIDELGRVSTRRYGNGTGMRIWAEFDTIEIYANATTIASPTSPGVPELFGATPTMTLTAPGDFIVTQTVVHGAVPGADVLETSVSVLFDFLTEDTWFVVVVKGTDGVSEPMFPVFPKSLDTGSNLSVADLIDGNLGESGTMALGATNALYVDADGVPGWRGPLEP